MIEKRYGVTPGGLPVSPVSGHGFVPPDIYGRRHPLIDRSLRADHGDADNGNGDDVDGGNNDGDNGEPDLHIDQGIKAVDVVPEGPSGIRPVTFEDDPLTGAPDEGDEGHPPPYVQVDPSQSGVGGQVPWHQQGPSDTPAPRTTPFQQVWD